MQETAGSAHWFHRLVSWAASAYYLYWAVGVLGAAAAMGAGYFQSYPPLRNLLYYTCGVLGALFALFLALRIRARAQKAHRVLNPSIALEQSDAEYWVQPDALRELERANYRATAPVDLFVFSVSLTGTATIEVFLKSLGELRGPITRKDRSYYQVIFPQRLRKGDRYTLEVEKHISDPQRTMKPFIAKSYSNCARYGSLHMKVHFSASRPSRVFYDAHKLETGPLQEPIEELFLSADASVSVPVNQIEAGYAYCVSWSW